MTQPEFDAYLAHAIPDYAAEQVRSGSWSAAGSRERAESEYRRLLKDGPATEGQHVFTIRDPESGEAVGMLWVAVDDRGAGQQVYVYDVRIHEGFQRRGYARRTFVTLEKHMRDKGLSRISLHVFGHNTAARKLYERLGFEVTGLVMSKSIEGG